MMHALHQHEHGAKRRSPCLSAHGRAWMACLFVLAACSGAAGAPDRPAAPGGAVGSTDPLAPGGTGVSGGPGAGGSPGATAGVGGGGVLGGGQHGGGAPVVVRCTNRTVGVNPMRRLTHREYGNAVRDLLGDRTQPDAAFAADTQKDLFDTMANQHVATLLADQYLDAAQDLAEGVTDVKALAGCDPAANATCARDFIKRFGRRAFRRPLTDQELTRLTALYDSTRMASDAPTGVRAMLAAVLASPYFLFRPEFGAGASTLPSALKTSPFEISARLSFLLWASVPDDTLLDAAAAGQLASKEQVASQARRMLADTRAREGMRGFYEQWIGIALLSTTTKDAATYPSYNDALRDAMLEETRRFIDHVLWQDDAKLSTLLTAPYGFVNAALAKVYGVRGPSDGSFGKVDFDPTQRSGLLTQASLLTAYASTNTSSPVKRGKWVRTRMLCHDLPEPPASVPPLPPPKQGVSTRERFAMHTSSAACSGCHTLIDGLGFGLERYDGIGAIRTMDLGVAVDARGEVTHTMDIDGAYEGGPELAALLADSEQVQNCAPTQWLRYSLGRRELADDTCSLAELQDTFRSQGGDLKQLMVALAQSDALLNYRKPD
jgi:hypothetical protein